MNAIEDAEEDGEALGLRDVEGWSGESGVVVGGRSLDWEREGGGGLREGWRW